MKVYETSERTGETYTIEGDDLGECNCPGNMKWAHCKHSDKAKRQLKHGFLQDGDLLHPEIWVPFPTQTVVVELSVPELVGDVLVYRFTLPVKGFMIGTQGYAIKDKDHKKMLIELMISKGIPAEEGRRILRYYK